jgi:hypothetical protein
MLCSFLPLLEVMQTADGELHAISEAFPKVRYHCNTEVVDGYVAHDLEVGSGSTAPV